MLLELGVILYPIRGGIFRSLMRMPRETASGPALPLHLVPGEIARPNGPIRPCIETTVY